jgi:hypothetical protein
MIGCGELRKLGDKAKLNFRGAKMLSLVEDKWLFGLAGGVAPFAAIAGILCFVAVAWFGVGKKVGSGAGDSTWYFADVGQDII